MKLDCIFDFIPISAGNWWLCSSAGEGVCSSEPTAGSVAGPATPHGPRCSRSARVHSRRRRQPSGNERRRQGRTVFETQGHPFRCSGRSLVLIAQRSLCHWYRTWTQNCKLWLVGNQIENMWWRKDFENQGSQPRILQCSQNKRIVC